MHLLALATRLRRPLTIVASVGAVVAMTFPLQAQQPKVSIVPQQVGAPQAIPNFVPARVLIPKLGVNAPTTPVGVTADGAMGTPTNAIDIAWWFGRKAGDDNTLLAAHHDWNGEAGSFYRLEDLRVGDTVIVEGQGKTLTYVVTWTKQVNGNIDATKLLGRVGKPVATLITCGGAFNTATRHHVDRIVVRAEMIWA